MHVKCVLMNQRRDYWCLAVVTDVALLAGYNMCSPTWRWAWQCVSDMGGAVCVGLIFFSHSDWMHVLWSPTGSPHGSVNSERISVFVCEIRASSADRNCWSKQRNTRNILRNKITSHTVSIDQKGNSLNTSEPSTTVRGIFQASIVTCNTHTTVSIVLNQLIYPCRNTVHKVTCLCSLRKLYSAIVMIEHNSDGFGDQMHCYSPPGTS